MTARVSSEKILLPVLLRGIMFAVPMLVIANLILWLAYQISVSTIRAHWQALSNLSVDATLMALEQRRNDVRADLNLLAADPGVGRVMAHPDAGTMQRIASDWELFVAEKQLYDQVRLIDLQGQERIRVNLTPYGASRTPQSMLQNKADRYYFQEALTLYPGQIYASPIDLNVEHGEIEEPYKPMLRLATLVMDGDGKRTGLLVINVLASYIFDNLARHAQLVEGRMLLLDDSGYYLRGFTADQEWGFMFPETSVRHQRFKDRYPKVWAEMQRLETGQIDDPEGLFTFRTVKYGAFGQERSYRLVVAILQARQESILLPQKTLWGGVSLTLSVLLMIISLWVAHSRVTVSIKQRQVTEASVPGLADRPGS
ncbi:MAG: cache domain-containing protein [Candidatus Thiodiazotropha sp.]